MSDFPPSFLIKWKSIFSQSCFLFLLPDETKTNVISEDTCFHEPSEIEISPTDDQLIFAPLLSDPGTELEPGIFFLPLKN